MEDLLKLYTEIYDLKKKFDGLNEQDPGDNDSLYKLFLTTLRDLQTKIEKKYDAILETLKGLEFEIVEDMQPIIDGSIV